MIIEKIILKCKGIFFVFKTNGIPSHSKLVINKANYSNKKKYLYTCLK